MTAFLVATLGMIAPHLPDSQYDPSALVFRLTVSPAAVPSPRLKYELLPRAQDHTPGNALVDYLRAGSLLPKPPRLEPDLRDARENMLNYWRGSPPHSLPLAGVKRESQPFAKAMEAADRAARCSYCEWQMPDKINISNTVSLNDAPPLREVMEWLSLRVKVELAEDRTHDTVRTLQTMFQMAKHAGEGPTLIQSLIGAAFASYAAEAVDRWASHPGTPNLYWALATLPNPLIDLRPMLVGEFQVMSNTFPAHITFEKGPVSEKDAQRLVANSQKLLTDMLGAYRVFDPKPAAELPTIHVPDWLPWELYIVWKASAARRWLREQGVPDTNRMAATQVVYLAGWRKYRDAFDQMTSAVLLPLPRSAAEAPHVAGRIEKSVEDHSDDRVLFWPLMAVSVTDKIFWAYVRQVRRFAALQAVEAIRAHLAAGKGFPTDWAEVTTIPVPDDPLTGKPFVYTLKDGVATIAAPPPNGEKPTRSNNFRYELRLRPMK